MTRVPCTQTSEITNTPALISGQASVTSHSVSDSSPGRNSPKGSETYGKHKYSPSSEHINCSLNIGCPPQLPNSTDSCTYPHFAHEPALARPTNVRHTLVSTPYLPPRNSCPLSTTFNETKPLRGSPGKYSTQACAPFPVHIPSAHNNANNDVDAQWTAEEHNRFLEGFRKYGNNWVKISQEYVRNKTLQQLSHRAEMFIYNKVADSRAGVGNEAFIAAPIVVPNDTPNLPIDTTTSRDATNVVIEDKTINHLEGTERGDCHNALNSEGSEQSFKVHEKVGDAREEISPGKTWTAKNDNAHAQSYLSTLDEMQKTQEGPGSVDDQGSVFINPEKSVTTQWTKNYTQTHLQENIDKPSESCFARKSIVSTKRSARRGPRRKRTQPSLIPFSGEEHSKFLLGYRLYGKKWKKITRVYLPHRTPKEVHHHAQKVFSSQVQQESSTSNYASQSFHADPSTRANQSSLQRIPLYPNTTSGDSYPPPYTGDDLNDPHVTAPETSHSSPCSMEQSKTTQSFSSNERNGRSDALISVNGDNGNSVPLSFNVDGADPKGASPESTKNSDEPKHFENTIDDECCNAGNAWLARETDTSSQNLPWTDEECKNFLIGYKVYSKQWDKISQFLVPTRTSEEVKAHAMDVLPNKSANAHVSISIENNQCSEEEKGNIPLNINISWTEEEKAAFLNGYRRFGKRWGRIAYHYVKTRSWKQVRAYAFEQFAKTEGLPPRKVTDNSGHQRASKKFRSAKYVNNAPGNSNGWMVPKNVSKERHLIHQQSQPVQLTDEERSFFMQGYAIHGNDWNMICRGFLPGRHPSEVASYAKCYFSESSEDDSDFGHLDQHSTNSRITSPESEVAPFLKTESSNPFEKLSVADDFDRSSYLKYLENQRFLLNFTHAAFGSTGIDLFDADGTASPTVTASPENSDTEITSSVRDSRYCQDNCGIDVADDATCSANITN